MAIFGPKPWINPFGKMSIFRLFDVVVFIAQKGVFSLQNIVKDISLCYIPKKDKVGKRPIFGPKPWVWKNVNFSTFCSSFFYSQERRFFVLEYRKDIFLCFIAENKKMEKWPFLDQNHEVTPLEKCQFLYFMTSCFYSLERRFFVVKYRKGHFPMLQCLKKNSCRNAHFWTKTMG